MLRKLSRRLTYANVMSTIAVVVAVGTGSAYAANTVFSSDIVDGEVKSVDIGANAVDSARVRDNTINTFDVHSFLGVDVVDNTLTGADIGNGSLKDEDIAEATFVQFDADIGVVPKQTCTRRAITGINARADHLLLTAGSGDASAFLSYGVEYDLAFTDEKAYLKICNPTLFDWDDQHTHFNLLVFNAQ